MIQFMRVVTVVVVLVGSLALGGRAAAAVDPPETVAGERLVQIMDWMAGGDLGPANQFFAPSFLMTVPAAQLPVVRDQIKDMFIGDGGVTLEEFESSAEGSQVVAVIRSVERGKHLRVTVVADPETRLVSGFLVQPAPEMDDRAFESWAALDEALGELPGKANLGAYEIVDGEPVVIHEYNGAERLALGSAFKLYVLGALAEMVRDGEASWDEPLAITDEDRSLPSGQFQTLAAGAERPLSEYALMMISISDNTATDHLITRVGRERVEAYMSRLHGEPEVNMPFLKTTELFTLKLGVDEETMERYLDATVAERRAMLAMGGVIHATDPDLARAAAWVQAKNPIAIDRAEWFATPGEMAALFADLNKLESLEGMDALTAALTTNPGVSAFDSAPWSGTGFKGGSEPGVINLTFKPVSLDGRVFVLTVGWNNTEAAVDDIKAIELVTEAAGLLGEAAGGG